jgi:hypothetical protein
MGSVVAVLQQSVGEWLSQRTDHGLDETLSKSQRCQVSHHLLSHTDPQWVQLSQARDVDPSRLLIGLKSEWQPRSPETEKSFPSGATILGLLPETETTGQVIVLDPDLQKGSYSMGEDAVLRLFFEKGDWVIEEQLWFAGENLRLRTTLLKQAGVTVISRFYSEIRKLATPSKSELNS